MAKVTVTLPDGTLASVEAAAKAAGTSVSSWIARVADAAAVRAAAARFTAALTADPQLAAEHDDAVRYARAAGARTGLAAAARMEAGHG